MLTKVEKEKIKEFERKFCYWHGLKDKTGSICKPTDDGFKFHSAKKVTDWLEKAFEEVRVTKK